MNHDCCECRRSFPEDEIIMFGEVPVCSECRSLYLQKLYGGLPTGSSQMVWQDQAKGIIFPKEAILPWRCCKCGDEPEKALTRKLFWHHPSIYLAFLLNIIIYIILALVMRKQATVQIPMCRKHLDQRRNRIITAWGLVLLAIVLLILAIQLPSSTLSFACGVSVPLVFIAALIFGIASQPVKAKKITKTHVWLSRYAPLVRTELPVWQGPLPE